jgi:plastocyanin
MAPGARRWTVGVALAAALLPAAALAGAARQPSTAVGVGAREYRLGAYRSTVPRGVVRFNLTNYGEDRHDLVVLDRRGRMLARSGEVRSGGRATVRVRLVPGTYTLRCDIADHARLGMHTTIRVTR